MDTLPLPPHPDLAQYRKRAKELVQAAREDAVRAWAEDWLEALLRLREENPSPFVRRSYVRAIDGIEHRSRESSGNFKLADAQFAIARAHGFTTWRDFADHVERLSNEKLDLFESAADAIVTGDLSGLESLVRANPDLVRARSSREHRAMLLHYVAANGVEDFRQLTPSNAVEVAKTLLEAGADVDALANTYGGGSAQTTLNLLVSSSHPAHAGCSRRLSRCCSITAQRSMAWSTTARR